MREFLSIAKALSDENRVRALLMLRHSELCLCQIIEMLALAPSTVSKHMSILFQAQLVNTRKEGKWNYYRLADDAPDVVATALEWTLSALEKDPQAMADTRQIKVVCKKSKQELCQHYRTGKDKS